MKINLPYKHMSAIIGIPRSGTTIVNSIFDSLINGFSLSEPFMCSKLQLPIVCNKVNHEITRNPEYIIPEIEEMLINTPQFELGSFKETYRKEKETKYLFDSELIDFIIFVIRDPRSIFSSWFKMHWTGVYNQREYLHHLYSSLYEEYIRQCDIRPTFIIKYEDLCETEDKLKYLNTVFDEYLTISDGFNITKTNYFLGDGDGLKSNEIKPLKMEFTRECLHLPNYNFIMSDIYPIYEKFVDRQKTCLASVI